MQLSLRAQILAFTCCLIAFACTAGVMALTAEGQNVVARRGDPERGAKELGPIEVAHGYGCGAYGSKGSYEGALTLLRNRTAEMGGDYVEIMTITEPHQEGDCGVNKFVIRGIAFKRANGSVATEPASPESAPPARRPECAPPCSPGYACDGGVCQPLCNPPCSPGYVCGMNRTCESK